MSSLFCLCGVCACSGVVLFLCFCCLVVCGLGGLDGLFDGGGDAGKELYGEGGSVGGVMVVLLLPLLGDVVVVLIGVW